MLMNILIGRFVTSSRGAGMLQQRQQRHFIQANSLAPQTALVCPSLWELWEMWRMNGSAGVSLCRSLKQHFGHMRWAAWPHGRMRH